MTMTPRPAKALQPSSLSGQRALESTKSVPVEQDERHDDLDRTLDGQEERHGLLADLLDVRREQVEDLAGARRVLLGGVVLLVVITGILLARLLGGLLPSAGHVAAHERLAVEDSDKLRVSSDRSAHHRATHAAAGRAPRLGPSRK